MVTIESSFLFKLIAATAISIVGYFFIRRVARRFIESIEQKTPREMVGFVHYFLFYGLYFILLAIVFQTIGIDLTTLIGAAGIAGIAVGFAAQTTLSNIISGIMVLIEQPFKVGDVICCEILQGVVESIGLLSLTLRTADNRLIRIPHEKVAKDNIVNITAREHRVLILRITVDIKDDVYKVIDLLEKVATDTPYRVKEKPVVILFDSVKEKSVGVPVATGLVPNVHLVMQLHTYTDQIGVAKSAFIKAFLQKMKEEGMSPLIGISEQ